MSDFELCLLDCQSIQQYVFGSNKLRTNIGASENVAAIFEETLQKTLTEQHDITSWLEEPAAIKIFDSDKSLRVEAGYIGGGNALLIFRKDGDENPAKDFVKRWSKRVLIEFPGIVPAAAISDTFIMPDSKMIRDEMLSPLFRKLSVEKNKAVPITNLPRHGITAECKITGLSAEKFDNEKNVKAWTSSVNISKILTASEYVKSENSDPEKLIIFEKSGKSTYRYTYTEEKLGQTEAHNHIAVVHIDGNSMGKQFQACRDLTERRNLSLAVSLRTEDAWESIVLALLAQMPKLIKENIVKPEKSDDKLLDLLPLRKLILNGDDLTFICNAQLAFWLTELFFKGLAAEPLKNKNEIIKDSKGDEIRMSACAGIAIVKTKFPFYRAYQLAEELCSEAKKKGRDAGESWIDFEIVYGGLSGDLEKVRERKYMIGKDSLLQRPWRVLDAKGNLGREKPYDFENLKKAVLKFLGKRNGVNHWPRSKRKEFLETLSKSKTTSKNYQTILQARNLTLPDYFEMKGAVWGKFDDKIRTPYFDVLQALEFYPEILLEDKK